MNCDAHFSNGTERRMMMKMKMKWSSDCNWTIANGSLDHSITVESSDYPISEPDPEDQTRKPPLLLKPLGSDSGPCEINICLDQKYEVCQIYVRSSARVYEVYYAPSPQSSSEYLCTVKCGLAERDDALLRATLVEDLAVENGGGSVGELTDGGNVVSSDDDWVKIKAPEVSLDKVDVGRVTSIQDLYEATAQISDAEPCSQLTIRLLSLQDKGYVYVDEVYVFVDPVEPTNSETDAPAGNSAQSSLIAMFMPTLMQLSKSSASRVKDNHVTNELQKADSMRRVNGVDVGLEKNLVDTNNVKMKELDKDTAGSNEIPHPMSAPDSKKCAESIDTNDLPPGRLERALEQLISRVSRVEDICLRFEEKLLKPIESIEARFQQVEHQLETRLQQVENQLEKLTKKFQYPGLPHCTGISAPSFSCNESNSSSFYHEGRDCPPSEAPETEKNDLSCDITPDSYNDVNIRPSLIIRAPEFSFNEDEENNVDLKASVDFPCTKPKKPLSVDDALAAALSGFLSDVNMHHSENSRSNSGLLSEAEEENQHVEHTEACHMKPEESSATENCNSKSSRYTQVLAVTAPDFTGEEIDNENSVNGIMTSSDTAAVLKNEEKEYYGETVPSITEIENIFTSAYSSDAIVSESLDGFVSASNEAYSKESVNEFAAASNDINTNESVDDLVTASDDTSSVVGTCLGNGLVDEINPHVSESSCVSSVDFEFPILEVNFTSNVHVTTKSPLEALLDGEAESNFEAPISYTRDDGDDNTEQTNAVIRDTNGTLELLPGDLPLLDFGFSAADGSSNLENKVHSPCTPSNPEMISSLI